METRRATIQDVAKQAGVSITTVSRYLNGRFDAMSEETRQRIVGVIQALNYQPNALAQGLKGNKSKMVAVIVVNLGYPFCVSLMRALSNMFSPAGYNLLVCETGGDAKNEARILSSLQAQQVDAMIIQTNGYNNQDIARIAKSTPTVLVDRQFSIPGVANIVTNNQEVSHELCNALFAEGYQAVLYVTEQEANISTRKERLSGYVAACEQHQIKPWVGFVTRGEPATFEQLLASMSERTVQSFAIYTANALLMMELYPYIRQLKLDIPSQVGLATFDEPDWIDMIRPTLTCIRQPTQEIGTMAARLVLRMLTDEPVKRTRKIHTLSSTLLLGESTRLRYWTDR